MRMTHSIRILQEFTPAMLTQPAAYSFMNLASLSAFFEGNQQLPISYFCDGMLMSGLVRQLTGRPVQRVSFDFTSIAEPVMQLAAAQQLRLFIVGAEAVQLEAFVHKITQRFPQLILAGWSDGYFDEAEQVQLCQSILAADSNIVIAGLGAGKQERFIADLMLQGFQGAAFTCGGFIRQEAGSQQDYYPPLINKLGLRAFYRMYKEPHTIRRYLLDYPKNLIKFVWLYTAGRLKVQVSPVES